MVSSRPQMVSLQLRRGQVVHPTTTRLPEYIHPARESTQRASWALQYPRPMQTYHPGGGESNVEAHWTSTWEDKNKVYAPYPKWVTLLGRGVLAMFELAAVAYLVHFARGWRGEGKVRGLDAGIGDVSCVGSLGRKEMWKGLTRGRSSLRFLSTLLRVSRPTLEGTAGGGCGFVPW